MSDHPAGADDGHIKGRPISWVVVVLIAGGFLVAGIGLVLPLPWLVIVALAVVAVGTIVGWATHAMADVSNRPTPTSSRVAEPAKTLSEEPAAH